MTASAKQRAHRLLTEAVFVAYQTEPDGERVLIDAVIDGANAMCASSSLPGIDITRFAPSESRIYRVAMPTGQAYAWAAALIDVAYDLLNDALETGTEELNHRWNFLFGGSSIAGVALNAMGADKDADGGPSLAADVWNDLETWGCT